MYKALAKEFGISQEKARKIVKRFLELASEKAIKGEKVIIPGYISVSVVERKARTGVNPRTKEKIKIPAKKVLKIKAGKKLQEKI